MRRVAEFRESFDDVAPGARPELAEQRRRLLDEESREAAEALAELAAALRAPAGAGAEADVHRAYRAVAKELADVLYVTYGAADALGIDLPAVFAEVHRSNMTKRAPDGTVLRRPDGKVLKGPSYRPPNLDPLVPPPRPGA